MAVNRKQAVSYLKTTVHADFKVGRSATVLSSEVSILRGSFEGGLNDRLRGYGGGSEASILAWFSE